MKNKIIEIDLGTTNSYVCAMDCSKPKVLETPQRKRVISLFVDFKDSEIIIGEAVKRQIYN